MKFLWWTINKRKYNFEDSEIKATAEEVKREKHELKLKELQLQSQLKQSQIQESINALRKGASGGIEETLLQLGTMYLTAKLGQKPTGETPTPAEIEQATGFDINTATEEEIEALIKKIPEPYAKQLAERDEEEVKKFIQSKQPLIKDEALEKVFKVFRKLYPKNNE